MDICTFFSTFLIWLWPGWCRGSLLTMESNKVYTPSWAIQLHSAAKDEDARFIANTLGLKYQKILPNNYYLLTDGQNQELLDQPNIRITEAIQSFSKVTWVEQQVAESFYPRSEFSDPLWNKQHHLKPSTTEYKVDHHVEKVWSKGYTGKNITVVVIDDGVRGTHLDLRNRYDTTVSTTIANGTHSSGHGTKCAGVIAAQADNSLCGVGVAYECNIAGIKLFADKSSTDAQNAQALYRANINPSKADIFSNSWGPSDRGYTIGGPGRLAVEAFKHGIEKGRNGLGSIYVFSCGNGANFYDSCAFDGYVNSIYTIAVASISKDGKVTGFSERCSAIMTAVYSTDMVTLSNKNDYGCVTNFGRTSAAAAFVSGILALALQANRNLTWRDMQHLIARSSRWNDVDPAVKRVTNGKNYTVNENFGFGILDASALIINARKWGNKVPDQIKCSLNVTAELGIQVIPTTLDVDVSNNVLNCESKLIKSLEHVELRIDLNYTNRAVLIIDVTSQFGTSSRFLYPRIYDFLNDFKTYNNLVVTSVHFWGEPILGRWSVDIKEGSGIHNINGTGTLFNISLIFYGTTELLKENGNGNDFENNTSNGNKPATDEQRSTTSIFGTTPTTSATDVESKVDMKSHKVAVIAGSVCGVFLVIALSAGVVYKLKRRSNRSTQRSDIRQNEQELSNKNSHPAPGNVNTSMV